MKTFGEYVTRCAVRGVAQARRLGHQLVERRVEQRSCVHLPQPMSERPSASERQRAGYPARSERAMEEAGIRRAASDP